jgi:molecular chaperone GrpE (heat shock protein)
MFLYSNTIVSERYLTIQSEPVIDFCHEAMSYNTELLSNSLRATKEMLTIFDEYGTSKNIVTEATTSWFDKIVKFLKEFKAKVVTLFRRWIDWIAKKLHIRGKYSDEAMEEMISKNRDKLKGFTLELPEPIDYGFAYFNELANPTVPKNVTDTVDKLKDEYKDVSEKHPQTMDIKSIRDGFQNTSNSLVNGMKTGELNITTMEALLNNKKAGKDQLEKYRKAVMDAIDDIDRSVKAVSKNSSNIVIGDQNLVNAMLTMITRLNEHLTTMANAYPNYINNIDKAVMEFLPKAEQYLMANN